VRRRRTLIKPASSFKPAKMSFLQHLKVAMQGIHDQSRDQDNNLQKEVQGLRGLEREVVSDDGKAMQQAKALEKATAAITKAECKIQWVNTKTSGWFPAIPSSFLTFKYPINVGTSSIRLMKNMPKCVYKGHKHVERRCGGGGAEGGDHYILSSSLLLRHSMYLAVDCFPIHLPGDQVMMLAVG
jgi:hypothetical protein